ncbi:hypothetical protein TWF718_003834 [Orbilia javanica]|uniref:Uncharacterized protein n=1 Tax=Orbilia javanica TaxID=47235 RepID=A0AAN8N1H6_9PEZI
MQYSTIIRQAFFTLFVVACTVWASAIPVTTAVGDEFLPMLRIEELLPGKQSTLDAVSPNPRPERSFIKRHFGAPLCWKAPNGYANRNVVLNYGVPTLRAIGKANLVVPAGSNCGIAYCRNYKTHKTAIIVCAKPGFRIQGERVAVAAEKIVNTCRRENWKTNGKLVDTTGYDIRVSGAGCQ